MPLTYAKCKNANWPPGKKRIRLDDRLERDRGAGAALITFTDAPMRAATVLDGDANTLYSLTIAYAFTDSTQNMNKEANQGGPFGDSRERWIRNDPSLHTDCIRAALRIESYGAYAKNNSDIYALLRRQYRPVEMLKFPEDAHPLSRSSGRMISLQVNVDWYRFWLKGECRQVPSCRERRPTACRTSTGGGGRWP